MALRSSRSPAARHGAGHTRDFDDLAAWLAVRTSTSAVCELLRIAWRTVGSIVARVNADIDAGVDRLDGLRRIGIDEISYKRGHRYLIVVVDHDTGRLVWAATTPPLGCSSTSSAQSARPN
jgi:transposase